MLLNSLLYGTATQSLHYLYREDGVVTAANVTGVAIKPMLQQAFPQKEKDFTEQLVVIVIAVVAIVITTTTTTITTITIIIVIATTTTTTAKIAIAAAAIIIQLPLIASTATAAKGPPLDRFAVAKSKV